MVVRSIQIARYGGSGAVWRRAVTMLLHIGMILYVRITTPKAVFRPTTRKRNWDGLLTLFEFEQASQALDVVNDQ